MSIEELRAKYAAAYDSDFEMPRDSGDESTDIADSDDDQDVDEDEEATTEGQFTCRLASAVHSIYILPFVMMELL